MTADQVLLWAIVAVLLVLLLRLGKATSEGLTTDLGRAASQIPDPVREFALALVQVGAIAVPVVILGLLVWLGWEYARFAWAQRTPVLRLSAGMIYLAVPVGCALMLVHLALIARRYE